MQQVSCFNTLARVSASARKAAKFVTGSRLFALHDQIARLTMTRYPQLKDKERNDRMDERAPEQDQDADDEAEILRQLGHDLLPFNGGDRSNTE